ATGKGHGTDTAVMLGLAGHQPESVDVDRVEGLLDDMRASGGIELAGRRPVGFDAAGDIRFHPFKTLPLHPNGMLCTAYGAADQPLLRRSYYSVGGGFVVPGSADGTPDSLEQAVPDMGVLPMPFRSGDDLLRLSREHACS